MVDGPVPDSAMDTKSEEGDPGSDEDTTTPLTEDEQAILARLREAGGGEPEQEQDTTLPGAPPPSVAPDPLDPVFREPEN